MESMNAQSSMAHNARTMQTKRIKWKDIGGKLYALIAHIRFE